MDVVEDYSESSHLTESDESFTLRRRSSDSKKPSQTNSAKHSSSNSIKSRPSPKNSSKSRPSPKNSFKNLSSPSNCSSSASKLKSPKTAIEPVKSVKTNSELFVEVDDSSTVSSLWEELFESENSDDSEDSEISDANYKPGKPFNPNTPVSRNSSSKKSPTKLSSKKSSRVVAKKTQGSQSSTKIKQKREEFLTPSRQASKIKRKSEDLPTPSRKLVKKPEPEVRRKVVKKPEPEVQSCSAKEVYEELVAKYNRTRSSNKGKAVQFRWSRVTVHGWPQVMFLRSCNWSEEDVKLIKAFMKNITFSDREPTEKLSLKRMLKANRKLFERLGDNTRLLGFSRPGFKEINWMALHKEFPEIILSTLDWRSWSDTDRETIINGLIKKCLKPIADKIKLKLK